MCKIVMNKEKNLLIVFRAGIKYILVSTLVCALISFLLASFVIEKRYTAESIICINITDSYAADYDQLSLARAFADSYIAYINHDFIRSEISKRFRNRYTVEELANMIKVEKIDESQMLRISCTAGSVEEASAICSVIPEVASQKIYELTQVGSVFELQKSYVSNNATFPNIPLFTAIGAGLGFVLAYAAYYIVKIYFGKINFRRELEIMHAHPILGSVPEENI